jgi:hypothetical protein
VPADVSLRHGPVNPVSDGLLSNELSMNIHHDSDLRESASGGGVPETHCFSPPSCWAGRLLSVRTGPVALDHLIGPVRHLNSAAWNGV